MYMVKYRFHAGYGTLSLYETGVPRDSILYNANSLVQRVLKHGQVERGDTYRIEENVVIALARIQIIVKTAALLCHKAESGVVREICHLSFPITVAEAVVDFCSTRIATQGLAISGIWVGICSSAFYDIAFVALNCQFETARFVVSQDMPFSVTIVVIDRYENILIPVANVHGILHVLANGAYWGVSQLSRSL
jgi:hypothetical protein